jgi:hypothetical protein
MDLRCLTARSRTPLEKLVLMMWASKSLGVTSTRARIEHVDGICLRLGL